MGGYPGWHWTVSVAELPDEEPTVLEAELLPGDGALLAPDWVPWSERLEDYEDAQARCAAADGRSTSSMTTRTTMTTTTTIDDDHGDDPDDGIDFEDLGSEERRSRESTSTEPRRARLAGGGRRRGTTSPRPRPMTTVQSHQTWPLVDEAASRKSSSPTRATSQSTQSDEDRLAVVGLHRLRVGPALAVLQPEAHAAAA